MQNGRQCSRYSAAALCCGGIGQRLAKGLSDKWFVPEAKPVAVSGQTDVLFLKMGGEGNGTAGEGGRHDGLSDHSAEIRPRAARGNLLVRLTHHPHEIPCFAPPISPSSSLWLRIL